MDPKQIFAEKANCDLPQCEGESVMDEPRFIETVSSIVAPLEAQIEQLKIEAIDRDFIHSQNITRVGQLFSESAQDHIDTMDLIASKIDQRDHRIEVIKKLVRSYKANVDRLGWYIADYAGRTEKAEADVSRLTSEIATLKAEVERLSDEDGSWAQYCDSVERESARRLQMVHDLTDEGKRLFDELQRVRENAFEYWGKLNSIDFEKRNDFGKAYKEIFGEHPFEEYLRKHNVEPLTNDSAKEEQQ